MFMTLPNIFNHMPMGRLWGGLFFIFLSFAAMSTIIAVFENLISFCMDKWGWSRKKGVLVNLVGVMVLSMPCVLGSNVWAGVRILGMDISTVEDFLISQNILPLGSLVYLLFCVSKLGWGWENFLSEVNAGRGIKFPRSIRFYVTYVLPVVVVGIFIMGYISFFS